jgi:phosphodiesterase/alkaline phosphatase D-like protein
MRHNVWHRSWIAAWLALAAAPALAAPALATTAFLGVAAGDMSSDSVVLWTRAVTAEGTGTRVTARIATDPALRDVVWTGQGETVAADDNTLKLLATGLRPGTRYWYDFRDDAGTSAGTGHFRTAPAPGQAAALRFGFSGDADGRFRPYPLIRDIAARELDFFIFLGDTIYETGSKGSPPVLELHACDPAETLAAGLADYRRKYRENRLGVTAGGDATTGGQQGLVPMFAAFGLYTLLDNHELGNRTLQSGGARTTDPACGTAGVVNRSPGFHVMERAFYEYHPTRAGLPGVTVTAPDDPRSDGSIRNWFAQDWGRQAIYIQTDDRVYRDARLDCPAGAVATCPEAGGPDRTMLGATQFAWLTETLQRAEQAGTTWKFVAISTPIDETGTAGLPGTQAQDGKSWYGGYRAERDRLLAFIATRHIRNVVFLTTDDHQNRTSVLRYNPRFGLAGTTDPVPGAFQIVAGPIGAGGPDTVTDHSFGHAVTLAANRDASQRAAGAPELGLPADFPGLHGVARQGAPADAPHPRPVDFFSSDTFNYAVLDVAADGRLTVEIWGMCSHQPNTFHTDAAAPDDVCDRSVARPVIRYRIDPHTVH